jgi:transcriptional regulator with XRE-family HTH domain
MDKIKMGKYISKKRKDKGYSQEKLAEEVDVTSRTISDWERGKVDIKNENIERLAKALDVKYLEILVGEDLDELSMETENKIIEQLKFLDSRLDTVQNVTIKIEEGSLLSTDIGIVAMGLSMTALALASWAVFEKTTVNLIVDIVLGLAGIVFMAFGKVCLRILESRLKERKNQYKIQKLQSEDCDNDKKER